MFKNIELVIFVCACIFPVIAYSDTARTLQKNDQYSNDIPQLAKLVANVLNSHPKIQSLEAAHDAASAMAQAADQPLYNPELELDLESTDIRTSRLGILQTIDWSNKRGARSQAAQYEKKQFAANLQAARQTLAAELLQTLANYHGYFNRDLVAKKRIELLQNFVKLAEKRRQSGDLSQVELSLAQLTLADANIQRSRTQVQLIETRQVLTALVGNENTHWPGLPDTLPELKLADENLDDIVNESPLLRAQRLQIAAAKANIQLRHREQRPDPTIGLRGGRGVSENVVGLTLTIPIFMRNNFNAEVETANAGLIQVEREAQSFSRQAYSNLLSSARRYQLLRQTWQGWQQVGQANLSQQIDLIQQLWQAGEISTTDYFIQLNQTLDMRLSAIELRHDLWRNWIDWLLASNRVHFWLGLNELK